MTITEAMTWDLRQAGVVTGLNYWAKGGRERTYITISGYNPSYRGCRSHQLYWDHQTRRLVNRYGAGTRPDAFDASLRRVVDAFGPDPDTDRPSLVV